MKPKVAIDPAAIQMFVRKLCKQAVHGGDLPAAEDCRGRGHERGGPIVVLTREGMLDGFVHPAFQLEPSRGP